jgi:hypothetical protein
VIGGFYIFMTYLDRLKDPRWQKKRLEVLNRDNFTCRLCKDKETTLHVHHMVYSKSGNPWDVHNDNLLTLCSDCHEEIEYLLKILPSGKLTMVWQLFMFKFKLETGEKIIFTKYYYYTYQSIYNKKGQRIVTVNLGFFCDDITVGLKEILDDYFKPFSEQRFICRG